MPDTDRIPSLREMDHLNLDQHIDAEPAAQGVQLEPKPKIRVISKRWVWIPKAKSPLGEFIIDVLAGLQAFLDMLPAVVADSVFALTGIGFTMASVGYFAPAHLGAIGMAATIFIAAPISAVYFIRYRRDEHLQETVDALSERIIEMEHALSEQLDVLVRNA